CRGDRPGRRPGHPARPAGAGRGRGPARGGVLDPGPGGRAGRKRVDHVQTRPGHRGGDHRAAPGRPGGPGNVGRCSTPSVAAPGRPGKQGRATVTTRVMIVDDHPIWRDGLARDLAENGYDVVATAGDGAAAVRVAAAVRPQVVLMDLQ